MSVLICRHGRNIDLREGLWSVSLRLVVCSDEVRNDFWIPRHPQSHQWLSVCSVPVGSASSGCDRMFFRVLLSNPCLLPTATLPCLVLFHLQGTSLCSVPPSPSRVCRFSAELRLAIHKPKQNKTKNTFDFHT